MSDRPPLPPPDDDPSSRGVFTPFTERKEHTMKAQLTARDRDRLEAALDESQPLTPGERLRWERTRGWYIPADAGLIDAVLDPPAKPLPARTARAVAERYPNRNA